jgi:hypothetical protein
MATKLIDMFRKLVLGEPIKEEDSVKLFKIKIPTDKSSESDLKELVQALQDIPLAIIHTTAYIRSTPRFTVLIYLSLFRESKTNQASLLNNNEAKDLRRDYNIRHTVITAWQISFDQIQRTKAKATDLLTLISIFDRHSVPERLLDNNTDRLQFEDIIAPLISFSLV